MNKERKEIIASNEISQIETVQLGQYKQKILIEGKQKNLPIMIVLHGGPGEPIPFGVGARGLFPEITSHCICVYWDQYGCGINHAKLPQDIMINDFVEMTTDLIQYIKDKFPQNKLYLFGMSWGSVLSAKAALRKANCLDGVLVYGQVLYELMQSDEILQTILNSDAPQKVKKELQNIYDTKDFHYSSTLKISQWMKKYTEGYTNKNEPQIPLKSMLKDIKASPDYHLQDFISALFNGFLTHKSLINEMTVVDLRRELCQVTIPYRMIQGETDIVTSTKHIVEYVEESHNPLLTYRVVKDAAHSAGKNGMQAVIEEIAQLSKNNDE